MRTANASAAFAPIRALHSRWVFRRRVQVLSEVLAKRVPDGAAVLDVGCGNGVIGQLMKERRPTTSVIGLEVAPRPTCLIKCAGFDGVRIPLRENSVDVCLFVDVLHHTDDIGALLSEAQRVSRSYILIKDHLAENGFDWNVLKFMDWVGNRGHGVRLPYNYQSAAAWRRIFSECKIRVVDWDQNVKLYPPPFDQAFGRGLHFVCLLRKD